MASKWEKIQTLLDEASELTAPFRIDTSGSNDYAKMSESYKQANQKIEEAYRILTGREYKPNP